MRIHSEVFWAQKAGSSPSEYEDAYYPEDAIDADRPGFRFAIGDGATESAFSREWARLLVRAYVESEVDGGGIAALLPDLQARWAEWVGQKPLPWYAAEKAREGAFSSLLGLALREDPADPGEARWEAVAVGDSCLFQLRGGAVIARFPLEGSPEFTAAPYLLSSHPDRNPELARRLSTLGSECRSDDVFFLATDALACWFMEEDERGRSPWRLLADLRTPDQQEGFPELVERLRREGALRNDDSTLVRIQIG